jgi:hypothetical protein
LNLAHITEHQISSITTGSKLRAHQPRISRIDSTVVTPTKADAASKAKGEIMQTKTMLKYIREELRGTTPGDTTIIWYLPTGGAYIFGGDARSNAEPYAAINTPNDVEKYFVPPVTPPMERILEQYPGDGPNIIEGTKEELIRLLFSNSAEA